MNNKKIIFLLAFVIIIVAGFEIHNLTSSSLWHDEAFSGLLIQYDFGEMMHRIGLDVHPPFYYILLKAWTFVFSNCLFTLRLFSVFFATLTILTFYLLIKEVFKNKKFALFGSILMAFNSFQIQFAMEARMFMLGLFLVVLSTYLLFKALSSKKWFYWHLYALTIACGLYTHYYVFFSVLAQGIFALFYIFKESKFSPKDWLKNNNFKFGLGAYVLVFFSYLPWLKILLKQASQIQENYWIPSMNIWSIPATFFKILSGQGIDSSKSWYVLAITTILVIVLAIYAIKKIKNPFIWLALLSILIPFFGATALSMKSSIYLDRYFIFTLPFFLILIGGAIFKIKNKTARNSLIAIVVFGTFLSFPIHWNSLNLSKKPGMTGTANYLNQQVKPDEKIYVGSSFVYFTFKYHNKTGISPLLYAPGYLPHFSGTALLSSEDIIKDFNKETQKGDTVWLINTTGFGNHRPEIPKNWISLEEKGFEDVYGYRGWIVVTKYQVN